MASLEFRIHWDIHWDLSIYIAMASLHSSHYKDFVVISEMLSHIYQHRYHLFPRPHFRITTSIILRKRPLKHLTYALQNEVGLKAKPKLVRRHGIELHRQLVIRSTTIS